MLRQSRGPGHRRRRPSFSAVPRGWGHCPGFSPLTSGAALLASPQSLSSLEAHAPRKTETRALKVEKQVTTAFFQVPVCRPQSPGRSSRGGSENLQGLGTYLPLDPRAVAPWMVPGSSQQGQHRAQGPPQPSGNVRRPRALSGWLQSSAHGHRCAHSSSASPDSCLTGNLSSGRRGTVGQVLRPWLRSWGLGALSRSQTSALGARLPR